MTPEGFRQATLEHKDRLLTYAAWLLGDVEEARDLTQEALMRLWMHRESVARQAARTWLLRTVQRLAIDRLRRGSPRSLAERGRLRLPPAAAAPGLAAEERERRDAVGRALSRMCPADRSILLLREFQGLSYGELTRVLELPLGTVKTNLHRARRRLRAMLTGMEVGR